MNKMIKMININSYSNQDRTLKNDPVDHFSEGASWRVSYWDSIVSFKIWKPLYITMLIGCLTSCDDFVDVELPKNQLPTAVVFEDIGTATAAIRSVYANLRNENLPSTLNRSLGFYADELNPTDQLGGPAFFNHDITPLNTTVSGWWSAYDQIYQVNALIEGVERSTGLSLEHKNQLLGEAFCIRAYLHMTLTELFGAIPYITTTDYRANTTVPRLPVDTVYNQIITDILMASSLLGTDISGERIRVYDAVADALLARVYLYTENWEEAERYASKVIDNYSFVLEPNLNEVFLKNASGSIWQLHPGNEGLNTKDGNLFIFSGSPGNSPILSDTLLEVFEPNDLRASSWVGSTSDGSNTWHYAFKYKADNVVQTTVEYAIVLRLAEQYLIRAEARVMKENIDISGAQADLNRIRNRAGLLNTTANTKEELLTAILNERQVELFTEYGHRWFDLKRWLHLGRPGNAAEVLAPLKPRWQDTNVLFPVPESQILLNPNLLPQNDGYN